MLIVGCTARSGQQTQVCTGTRGGEVEGICSSKDVMTNQLHGVAGAVRTLHALAGMSVVIRVLEMQTLVAGLLWTLCNQCEQTWQQLGYRGASYYQ